MPEPAEFNVVNQTKNALNEQIGQAGKPACEGFESLQILGLQALYTDQVATTLLRKRQVPGCQLQA